MLKQTKQVRWSIWLSGMITLLGLALPTLPTLASDAESILKLNIIAAGLREQDFSCRSRASGERLDEGDTYTIKTTLFSSNSYALIGAGDSTVRDLDIELYDENFNLIDRDTQTDAYPIVKVTPAWSGTFYIRAKMYRGSGYSNVMICSK
jgi:hypothetical protein